MYISTPMLLCQPLLEPTLNMSCPKWKFLFPLVFSAVSVLERMLLLDPESRATASEALTLPYFAEFRDPEEEKEAQLYDHSLDNTDQPLSQWKRKDDEANPTWL